MKSHLAASKLLICTFFTSGVLLVTLGSGEKCDRKGPTVEQTQVGFGRPPKYMVKVFNNCPMCPIINIHLKCEGFPQDLINPKDLKVVGQNDCVVNSGLPLSPLHHFSFNYSNHIYPFLPLTWFFQCE